ncbi:hypothetical protein [Humisphaera borealis]|uniref:Uncharacterized protein n=1 Tax=Humisphaera borealis TaxID=2807512 RepID=A0A7M2WZX8_9BACT|nr:hypothetical protein [Humisphaera borealis]QOV91067.1 hypothetical protein IPV69_06825 [Humisphaera borealis]
MTNDKDKITGSTTVAETVVCTATRTHCRTSPGLSTYDPSPMFEVSTDCMTSAPPCAPPLHGIANGCTESQGVRFHDGTCAPFIIELSDGNPRHDVPFVVRLRRLLKMTLRTYGIRASWAPSPVAATLANDSTATPTTTPRKRKTRQRANGEVNV